MNLLDLMPNLWPAIIRGTIHGSIALIAVFLACRLIPRLPAWAKSWLWRLAWLRVIIAFITTASLNVPVLPAPKPTTVTATFAAPSPAPIDAELQPPAPVQSPAPVIPNYLLSDYLTAIWLLGIALMLARLAYHYRSVRRLRRNAFACEQLEIVAQLHTLAIALNAPAPALLVSATITKPLLTGAFKPAIILPPSVLLMTPANIELILKHELAHLKRRDLAWNALGAVAHILMWFNPLTWLCERESHFTQEAASDELALRDQTNRAPEFAGLLVEIAAKRERAPQLLTVSMIRTANTLERRLKAMKTIHHKGRRQLIATAAVMLALTPTLIPWRVVAQKTEPIADTLPAAPSTSSHERDPLPSTSAADVRPTHEEALLAEEIKLARKELDAIARANQNGVASNEEVIRQKREVQKLERDLAGLNNDTVKIRASLQEEIKDFELLQAAAAQRVQNGVASNEEKSKIDRELLHLKRELASLDRLKPAPQANDADGGGGSMSMMYYMSNPELMKRYFPQMYARMAKNGGNLGTNANFAKAEQTYAAALNNYNNNTNINPQSDLQNRLERAYRDSTRARIRLQPRRAGVVSFVAVKAGEQVERGQDLVQFDDREAQIRLRAAESEYEIAQADRELKKKEVEARLTFMLSQNPNGTDDYKKSQREEYELKLKKLDSELRLAFIKVEQAKLELEDRMIRAPVAGMVGSVVPLPGQSMTETAVALELLTEPAK